MAITKRDVDALLPGGLIWDSGRGAVTGFGARCQRAAKVFVLKAAIAGRTKWISIGRFGSPWTVDEARDRARVLLGQIATGSDPTAEREKPAEVTVSDLCDRYMEAAKAGRVLTRFRQPKKASTLAIDEGRVARHIKPLLGSRPIRSVTRADVLGMIDDIAAGRTAGDHKTKPRGRAIVRGGSGTAARVADLLSGIFSWAHKRGYVDGNPVHGAERYRGESKDRVIAPEEFGRLAATLDGGRDRDGRPLNPNAIQIIRLLALTGCRLNEIAALRRDELDLNAQCIRLASTKTGRSTRAVGTPAVRIFEGLPQFVDHAFVFPAHSGPGHYQGTKREVQRIFAAADIPAASCHTLRHTFATVASGLEFSDTTIAGLLGHKGRSVTSRYVHKADAALVAAANVVAGKIMEMMLKGR